MDMEASKPSTSRKESVSTLKSSCSDDKSEDGQWIQARYLVVLATFFANAVFYFMRINLSVAIVAMTLNDSAYYRSPDVPQYDWDASTRGLVLSSFFWGYVVTQVPAGYLAHKYGPKRLFLVTILLSSLFTFLFVPASELGWQYACAARVFLGLAQGALLPCCHGLLATWSLPNERGRMSVYTYTGQQFGTVVAMSCSGVISAAAGWPVVFYVSGGLGLVLAVVWQWLAADTPALSRFASPRERHLIESSISAAAGTENQDCSQPLKTPWLGIMTSIHMWALIAAHSAQNWGFWTLLTEIPSYMSGVLNFDLAQNGLLSSLPYIAMWATGLVLSWASDTMLKKNCCSVGASRKIGNSIAHYGSAILLIVLGYSSADEAAAVAILTVAVACSSGAMIGYQVNHIDLSPNFAGTMMGITNGISNIFSIFGPLVVGFIVIENDNAAQWRIVFMIAAGFYIVGNSIFVIFGSGEVQPWNHPDWQRHVTKLESGSSRKTSDTESNNNNNRSGSPKLHNY